MRPSDLGSKFDQGLALMLKAIADNADSGPPLLNPAAMQSELAELTALRGRPAFYPYLGSGSGRGARASCSRACSS